MKNEGVSEKAIKCAAKLLEFYTPDEAIKILYERWKDNEAVFLAIQAGKILLEDRYK